MTAESYRAAGVDIDAASAIKQVIHSYAKLTYGPQVLGGAGFFAGLYHLTDFRDPVLVASTDNVGTKLKVASLAGHFESVGVDVVNQNVNDLLPCGARPLFFLDYIAMSKLDARAIELISRGISLACRQAGCALIGGETAELPGVYQKDAFDLAGFVVGAVERDAMINGSTIVEGDVLLGVPSSGLHTNGYSLVRRIFDIDHTPSVLQRVFPELGKSLADELLTPHRGYWPLLEPVLPLVKGLGHITGGAWHKNVPRILPDGLAARVRLDAWEPPPIFKLIQQVGKVSDAEMYRVFNMGIGMALAVAPENVSKVRALLPEAFPIGDVVRQRGDARIVFEGFEETYRRKHNVTLVLHAPQNKVNENDNKKSFESIFSTGIGPEYALPDSYIRQLPPGSKVVLLRKDRGKKRAAGRLVRLIQTDKRTRQGRWRYDVIVEGFAPVPYKPERLDRFGVNLIQDP